MKSPKSEVDGIMYCLSFLGMVHKAIQSSSVYEKEARYISRSTGATEPHHGTAHSGCYFVYKSSLSSTLSRDIPTV